MKTKNAIGAAVVTGVIAMSVLIGCRKDARSGDETLPAGHKVKVIDTAVSIGPATSAVKPTLDQGWCGGHGVPESVCTRCDGTLIEIFKEAGDWCAGHGLPESQCIICNPQAEAEWAKLDPAADENKRDHSVADSAPEIATDPMELRVERAARPLTGTNDPVCQVENLRIRFNDPTTLEKAGIEVERAQHRRMSATLEVPAEVEFDATRLTRITPTAAGIVREVTVHVGAGVATGDPLAYVDSAVLGEAKSGYIERVQNLKLARADLQRVKMIAHGVENMLELCHPDAAAHEIREALADSPVGNAKATMLRAHAALQLARSDAARTNLLHQKNLSSERDDQAAQSELAAAEADFAATREEIAFNAQRGRITADRSVEVAKSALDASTRRLHILGLSEPQVDSIGHEPVEALSRFVLRSPVAGRVIERSATVGESVHPSQRMFVVVDTSTMWLMADLYERDLSKVKLDQPVLFTVDGMPGASFEGRVTWISAQLDERTRSARLRAELPNPDGVLKANMFGTARIVLHDNEEVVAVPAGSVQTDGCCQLVFVRQSETVFRPRKIVLGTSANGYVEVLRGLGDGEVVASVGSFLMKTEILKSNIGAGCCDVDPGR